MTTLDAANLQTIVAITSAYQRAGAMGLAHISAFIAHHPDEPALWQIPASSHVHLAQGSKEGLAHLSERLAHLHGLDLSQGDDVAYARAQAILKTVHMRPIHVITAHGTVDADCALTDNGDLRLNGSWVKYEKDSDNDLRAGFIATVATKDRRIVSLTPVERLFNNATLILEMALRDALTHHRNAITVIHDAQNLSTFHEHRDLVASFQHLVPQMQEDISQMTASLTPAHQRTR